jgi:serine/threonine protein kinase
MSPFVIRLLGKTEEGKLVFPALRNRFATFNCITSTVAIYKRWSSQMVEAIRALHKIDIVHRDLNVENLLWTEDGQQLVVSNLECHWGSRRAPEIRLDSMTDAGWSKQSDIYDVGCVIQGLVYANIPPNNQVEWHVHAPFGSIVAACKRDVPGDRPTVRELAAMIHAIDVSERPCE